MSADSKPFEDGVVIFTNKSNGKSGIYHCGQTTSTSKRGPTRLSEGPRKPSCSYNCLIGMALMSSECKRLPVNEIYSFILNEFPYFKSSAAPRGWKNSVRHSLSLGPCFRKTQVAGFQGKKGFQWEVIPEKLPVIDREIETFLAQEQNLQQQSLTQSAPIVVTCPVNDNSHTLHSAIPQPPQKQVESTHESLMQYYDFGKFLEVENVDDSAKKLHSASTHPQVNIESTLALMQQDFQEWLEEQCADDNSTDVHLVNELSQADIESTLESLMQCDFEEWVERETVKNSETISLSTNGLPQDDVDDTLESCDLGEWLEIHKSDTDAHHGNEVTQVNIEDTLETYDQRELLEGEVVDETDTNAHYSNEWQQVESMDGLLFQKDQADDCDADAHCAHDWEQVEDTDVQHSGGEWFEEVDDSDADSGGDTEHGSLFMPEYPSMVEPLTDVHWSADFNSGLCNPFLYSNCVNTTSLGQEALTDSVADDWLNPVSDWNQWTGPAYYDRVISSPGSPNSDYVYSIKSTDSETSDSSDPDTDTEDSLVVTVGGKTIRSWGKSHTSTFGKMKRRRYHSLNRSPYLHG